MSMISSLSWTIVPLLVGLAKGSEAGSEFVEEKAPSIHESKGIEDHKLPGVVMKAGVVMCRDSYGNLSNLSTQYNESEAGEQTMWKDGESSPNSLRSPSLNSSSSIGSPSMKMNMASSSTGASDHQSILPAAVYLPIANCALTNLGPKAGGESDKSKLGPRRSRRPTPPHTVVDTLFTDTNEDVVKQEAASSSWKMNASSSSSSSSSVPDPVYFLQTPAQMGNNISDNNLNNNDETPEQETTDSEYDSDVLPPFLSSKGGSRLPGPRLPFNAMISNKIVEEQEYSSDEPTPRLVVGSPHAAGMSSPGSRRTTNSSGSASPVRGKTSGKIILTPPRKIKSACSSPSRRSRYSIDGSPNKNDEIGGQQRSSSCISMRECQQLRDFQNEERNKRALDFVFTRGAGEIDSHSSERLQRSPDSTSAVKMLSCETSDDGEIWEVRQTIGPAELNQHFVERENTPVDYVDFGNKDSLCKPFLRFELGQDDCSTGEVDHCVPTGNMLNGKQDEVVEDNLFKSPASCGHRCRLNSNLSSASLNSSNTTPAKSILIITPRTKMNNNNKVGMKRSVSFSCDCDSWCPKCVERTKIEFEIPEGEKMSADEKMRRRIMQRVNDNTPYQDCVESCTECFDFFHSCVSRMKKKLENKKKTQQPKMKPEDRNTTDKFAWRGTEMSAYLGVHAANPAPGPHTHASSSVEEPHDGDDEAETPNKVGSSPFHHDVPMRNPFAWQGYNYAHTSWSPTGKYGDQQKNNYWRANGPSSV